MKTIELGTIIAKRWLELKFENGKTSSLVVVIGMPKKFLDSSDFYTPYQICGIGNEKVWYAGGVDAVQSLQLSMGMIGAELRALRSKFRVELRWEGDDVGRLGFDD